MLSLETLPGQPVNAPVQRGTVPLLTTSNDHAVRLPALELLRVRTAEQEEAARRAEVERALAHIRALASSVDRVGTRLTLTYWVEEGAITLLSQRIQPGKGARPGLIKEREKLGREARLALTGHGGNPRGKMELVLERVSAGWLLDSTLQREAVRPVEARRLAVNREGVAHENYLQAHDIASDLWWLLQVPDEGEAEQEVEVLLEDGRVVEVKPSRYRVVSGSEGARQVEHVVVGDVTWLLLGFAEGLGPRTLRLKLRAVHDRGLAQARAWVEAAQIQRPEQQVGGDEDFAKTYRDIHERTLRLWREELAEGARWVVLAGLEELSLWYAGGIIGRGAGVLAELTLPIVKGGAYVARWLRSATARLPPQAKQDFERLWAKVHLEGEAALSTTERNTLRKLMLDLERLLTEPIDDKAKERLRADARWYYERFRPELEALIRQGRTHPVHHRHPLEYAHLFPDVDINDPKNLALVYIEIHKGINRVWGKLRKGRPDATADEVRAAAREIDECFKHWYDKPMDPLWKDRLPEAEAKALQRLQQLFPGLE